MRSRSIVPAVGAALALAVVLAGPAMAQVPTLPTPGPSSSASPSPSPSPSGSPTPGGGAEPPAGAIAFQPGIDRSSWYWEDQIDQEVGAGPVAQRVRLRNPQSADTLPVSVKEGAAYKNAAIYFSLADRGVTPGSSISSLVLSIEEAKPGPEFPSFNTTDKVIEACRIADYWPAGEAEVWETMPVAEEGSCVDGTRAVPEDPQQPTTWTFDLTALATEWGADPFANNGVMLLGVPAGTGPNETWQINLKIPARDNLTTPNNEYEDTKSRAYIQLAFSPGAAATTPVAPTTPPISSDGGGGLGGSGTSFDSGGTGGSLDSGGGGDTTGFDSGGGVAGDQVPASPTSLPRMPWYVWVLLPIAIAAAAAVRMSLLETADGTRPDGVIAAIRRRSGDASTVETPED